MTSNLRGNINHMLKNDLQFLYYIKLKSSNLQTIPTWSYMIYVLLMSINTRYLLRNADFYRHFCSFLFVLMYHCFTQDRLRPSIFTFMKFKYLNKNFSRTEIRHTSCMHKIYITYLYIMHVNRVTLHNIDNNLLHVDCNKSIIHIVAI